MTDSKRKEYPQAEQSRQMIGHALSVLMKDRPYQDITISDLTLKADVSRRTFYRHFKKIDEVLEYVLHCIVEDFVNGFFKDTKANDIKGILIIYFRFCLAHKDFFLLIHRNHLSYLISEQVLPEIRDLIHKNMSDSIHDVNPEHMDYMFYFTSGGAVNLLHKWLEDGAVKSPEEMTDIAIESIKFFSQRL